MLGGREIKAGDMLLLGLAAGNTDPEIRPDLSVPVHGNRSHLAFSGGPHECPGQDIGRAIADTGIEALLARLPDLELAVSEGELTWRGTLMSRHLTALPVAFRPRTPDGSDAKPGMHEHGKAQPLPQAAPTPPLPPVPSAVPVPSAGVRRRPWWSRWFGRG
jgi:hypothetical protein